MVGINYPTVEHYLRRLDERGAVTTKGEYRKMYFLSECVALHVERLGVDVDTGMDGTDEVDE
ncbi:hypothetical protein GCM10009037_31040 [Halarchaeum grantii]|uniref:Uncharacterized protein n=1 Tax=Halarchaeum grantii TaxID=1193105 RepID=A0A830EZF3_9EURY|nr:hypothetical protein [Halarchaeum grantii]GGL45388.1 hypothetical protein GCM10009037_31040 [Halarchaeum grantii]